MVLKGKSLLASGITGCEGKFEIGHTVSVFDQNNKELAKGLVNYSSDEITKIKGKKSDQIESVLGYKDYDEVIHRDNLAILEGKS